MELFVEGTSCNFEDHPRTLQMKNCTRKLYVEGFFSTENTHEIANNYRNNKRRIPRRRRKSSVKFPKPSQNDPYHREVFQIPCFIYPRWVVYQVKKRNNTKLLADLLTVLRAYLPSIVFSKSLFWCYMALLLYTPNVIWKFSADRQLPLNTWFYFADCIFWSQDTFCSSVPNQSSSRYSVLFLEASAPYHGQVP